ncbi:MAG TPA: hypothetical protein PLI90_04020, partial [Rhodocyclaceae bacterium]|nr:hypothetical protein [Rhodocyclaceae bacterium]
STPSLPTPDSHRQLILPINQLANGAVRLTHSGICHWRIMDFGSGFTAHILACDMCNKNHDSLILYSINNLL